MYEYKAKILTNMTIEEVNAEIKKMQYNEYAHGQIIDRCRMWDLLATKKFLQNN